MPREATAYCPSGLQLLIRSRIGSDYNVLGGLDADPHGTMARYMEGVTLRTIERGLAYGDSQFYPDGRPIYNDDFLLGDFLYLTMFHFELSMPDDPIAFDWACAAKIRKSSALHRGPFGDDTCRGRERVRVKLGDQDSDGRKGEDGMYCLPVFPLSAEDAAAFVDGNRIEEEFNDGKIWMRLATRGSAKESDRRAAREKTEEEKFTSVVAGRILEVEGIGDKFEDIEAWAGKLDDPEIDSLIDILDRHDCGIDTAVIVECPGACMRDHDVDVQIRDIDFLAQRRKRRRRLRKR